MCAQRYFHFIYQEIVGTVKRRFDWQIHSFLCVVIFGEILQLVKSIFFFWLFFSLSLDVVFFGHLLQDIFFARKKAKFPLRCHTLSFSKKSWFFPFNFFSWLDWGHSTASNQLQIFLKIFFSMRTKEVCCDLFWIWPFSVWVQTLRILSME